MNSNYKRGRTREYAVVKSLMASGWSWAQRTAGSHSPVDVVAYKPGEVMFVQVKRRGAMGKTRKALFERKERVYLWWVVEEYGK